MARPSSFRAAPGPARGFVVEPSEAVLAAARGWLHEVREALGRDFVAAYIVGSALTPEFKPTRSSVDILLVARRLDPALLDRIARTPARRGRLHVAPLLYTLSQIERALDVLAVEFTEMREHHLRLEGQDVLGALVVPREALRRSCERELRLRHARLVQTYLRVHGARARLAEHLAAAALGLVPLGRSLLRLRGEIVPASGAYVLERVADVYGLDPAAFLFPYVLRYGGTAPSGPVLRRRTLEFVRELDRLVGALDRLEVR